MLKKSKDENFDYKKIFRYDKKSDSYIIDISIDIYGDLYNEWDFSPFKRRDLDSNLIEYLEESSFEIPLKHELIINFFMPEDMKNLQKEHRSLIGLKNYFKYMLFKTESEIRQHNIRAFKYALIGIVLVSISIFFQNYINKNLYFEILPEGFYVGGWVFIWEMFSIIGFQNSERKQKIKEYKRLIQSKLEYIYYKEPFEKF